MREASGGEFEGQIDIRTGREVVLGSLERAPQAGICRYRCRYRYVDVDIDSDIGIHIEVDWVPFEGLL